MKLHRLGGYVAIGAVITYLAAAIFTELIITGVDLNDPVKAMAAMTAAPVYGHLAVLLGVVEMALFFACFYALYDRMHADAPHLSQMMLIAVSIAFAISITRSMFWTLGPGMIIPAKDVSAYRMLMTISRCLEVACGHACGWTCLFLGCAIWKSRAFSRILGWLYVMGGILWIPNFFFWGIGFFLLTPIYTTILCVCTVWIGIELLRQKQHQLTSREMMGSSHQ
jgi:hypothetical protein